MRRNTLNYCAFPLAPYYEASFVESPECHPYCVSTTAKLCREFTFGGKEVSYIKAAGDDFRNDGVSHEAMFWKTGCAGHR